MNRSKEYQHFKDILQFFAQAHCPGCRQGEVQNNFCAAKTCSREKEVDFCFQCQDYPCNRNRYPEDLAQRWRAMNDRLKKIGIVKFYQEQKKRPRY